MRNRLDIDTVRAAVLAPGQAWTTLEFVPAIGSTNDRASELARRCGEPGLVVLTDHQTGGRGRLGRGWVVPDRASVAVSAVVPVAQVAAAGWVPLLAGLALARAIRRVTAAAGRELTPRLKWPNDVLLAEDGDRKVSGILCELVPLACGHGVVVGTGVNVDQSRAELPTDTATSLALAGATVCREDLVIAYLHELARTLGPAEPAPAGSRRGDADVGAAAGRAAYRQACSTIGAEVRVHLPAGRVVTGRAVAVDDDGALVVATPQGALAFAAADVVHVRPHAGPAPGLAESRHDHAGG